MFAGNLSDAKFKKTCPALVQKMLDVLRNPTLPTQENGRYDLEQGLFYVLMDYDTADNIRPESHRNYIDVQVVLAGRERMGWAPLSEKSQIETPYTEDKDIIYYYEPEIYSFLLCEAGACNLFFPNDIHAPGLSYFHTQAERVRKVVGKIPVELVL